MKTKFFLVVCLTVIISVLSFNPAFAAIKGQDVDLSTARISAVYPQTVLPGTLVGISGKGFGEIPGKIMIGSTEIDEFLSWDAKAIFIRIPEGVKNGDKIKVGDVTSDSLTLAPVGSIKVVWTLHMDKAQKLIASRAAKYKVATTTAFEAPLYIKGQWLKSGAKMGNFEPAWDGGARVIMYKDTEANAFISEFIFTPDNQATFSGDKAMAFCYEDANTKDRKVSSWESDASAILKLEWANQIEIGASNPTFKLSTSNRNYKADEQTIYVNY